MLQLTAIGLALRGGQSVISLASGVLLAHALGPSGRGEYFLFVAAVAVLARVVGLATSPSGVVFASRCLGWRGVRVVSVARAGARFAELGVAAALAIADVCSTLLILMLYVRIAATPVAQAVLPRTSDFGGVLRRVHP